MTSEELIIELEGYRNSLLEKMAPHIDNYFLAQLKIEQLRKSRNHLSSANIDQAQKLKDIMDIEHKEIVKLLDNPQLDNK